MSEQELQRAILDRLSVMPGVWCWRQNTGVARMAGGRVRFGLVGSGDISGGLQGGRRLELEVKTEKGQPSEEQVKFGAKVNAMGGLWAVVRSVSEAVAIVQEALKP